MVEANVDKIMQALNEKNTRSISDLSKKLSLPKEDVQKSVEYLEEDGVVKIDHKFPSTTVTLIKKQEDVKKEELPLPPKILPIQPEQPPVQIQPLQDQQLPPPPQKDSPQTLPKPEQPAQKLPEPPKKIESTLPQPTQLPQPPKQDLKQEVPPPPLPPQNLKKDTKLEIKPTPDLPKPPESKEAISKPGQIKEPVQPLSPPPPEQPKKEDKPFLMEEPKKTEPSIIKPTQGENLKASLDIMQESPVDNVVNKEPEKFDLENNPLNEGKPKFEMKAPSPVDYPIFPTMGAPAEMKTNMKTNIDQSGFPPHVESELDKIEYLLDKLDSQLNNHDYKNINTIYRQIYEMYNNSYDLSINERTLVNDRIQQIYQRVKRTYIIEGIT